MELYIGGAAQGKLAYVKRKKKEEEQEQILDQFHLIVREKIRQGENVEQWIEDYIQKHPDAIIICDEVGNGIVPMDSFEREYRERLGRILTELAKKAERVERILCGIGMRLK